MYLVQIFFLAMAAYFKGAKYIQESSFKVIYIL